MNVSGVPYEEYLTHEVVVLATFGKSIPACYRNRSLIDLPISPPTSTCYSVLARR